jgi:phosphinothricin acetyltransferase
LRIRLAAPEDAAAIAAIYSPAVTDNSTSFEVVAPDAAEIAKRMATITQRYPWIVCDDNGTVAGYAYGSLHRARYAYQWSAEVSAYVRDDYHRRGIGQALYTSLFAILALQGYRTAFAGITLPNLASVEFHKALGFSVIGIFHRIGYKFGEWHDTIWLERPLGEYGDAELPRPMSDVQSDPAFKKALAAGEKYL